MGAEIGPRLDKDLYKVPNDDLVQRVTGIQPERASGHAFPKDAGSEPRIRPKSYVELWEGPGWSQIGGHSLDEFRRSVWPWLKERGLATGADEPVLDEFLLHLSKLKRPAHLRAGLYARRGWSREDIGKLSTSQLASEIRDAVNTLLGAIGEPRFTTR